jgi:hypothetical protein
VGEIFFLKKIFLSHPSPIEDWGRRVTKAVGFCYPSPYGGYKKIEDFFVRETSEIFFQKKSF